MPRSNSVTAVRNVLDLVIAAVVCLGKVGSWSDNHISRHFRMYVAQHRYHPRLSKRERTLFTFGPGSEIVPRFLITADRGPKSIVLHGVAVLEFHRGALLNGQYVRRKHQPLLVHHRMVLGSR